MPSKYIFAGRLKLLLLGFSVLAPVVLGDISIPVSALLSFNS
jgi:hypothetical protein